MELLISVFCDLIHVLKFVVICDYLFLFQRRKVNNNVLLAILVSLIVTIGLFYVDNSGTYLLLYYVGINIIIFMLYNEKLQRILIIDFWLVLFIALLDQMTGVLVQTIMVFTGMDTKEIYSVARNILSIILVYTIGMILKRKNSKGIGQLGNKYLFLFLAVTTVDTLILVFLGGNINDLLRKGGSLSLALVFLGVIIGTFIQLGMVILLLISRNIYKENEQLAKKYLQEQEAHYRYLETREKETKEFRHDIRNHMHAISNLCIQQNYDALKEYLETLNGRIESFGKRVSVNNGIVDAILNRFFLEAEEKNIKLNVEGHFPTDCKITPFDLCTIFSNLLSNAIEAEQNCGGSEIKVFCRYTQTEIVLVMENDYKGTISSENGKFISSKSDKNNHGMGLANVKKSVESNQGYMDISTKNNKFKVTIMFERGQMEC